MGWERAGLVPLAPNRVLNTGKVIENPILQQEENIPPRPKRKKKFEGRIVTNAPLFYQLHPGYVPEEM